jgi:hypothetical protein
MFRPINELGRFLVVMRSCAKKVGRSRFVDALAREEFGVCEIHRAKHKPTTRIAIKSYGNVA